MYFQIMLICHKEHADINILLSDWMSFFYFQDAKQNVCNKPASENVESLEFVEYILIFDRTCEMD